MQTDHRLYIRDDKQKGQGEKVSEWTTASRSHDRFEMSVGKVKRKQKRKKKLYSLHLKPISHNMQKYVCVCVCVLLLQG